MAANRPDPVRKYVLLIVAAFSVVAVFLALKGR